MSNQRTIHDLFAEVAAIVDVKIKGREEFQRVLARYNPPADPGQVEAVLARLKGIVDDKFMCADLVRAWVRS